MRKTVKHKVTLEPTKCGGSVYNVQVESGYIEIQTYSNGGSSSILIGRGDLKKLVQHIKVATDLWDEAEEALSICVGGCGNGS